MARAALTSSTPHLLMDVIGSSSPRRDPQTKQTQFSNVSSTGRGVALLTNLSFLGSSVFTGPKLCSPMEAS